jgi:PAS domain S-box-containing protein
LDTELNKITTIDNLIDASDNGAPFDLNGHTFSVRRLSDYQSLDSSYHSRYFLLSDQILVVYSQGTPSPYDIRYATERLVHFLTEEKFSELDLIWDIKLINKSGIRTRKAMIEANRQLSKFIRSRCIVASPKYKILIRIYSTISQSKSEDLLFSESIDEALSRLSQKHDKTDNRTVESSVPEKSHLLLKTKEELADIILDYRKKHQWNTNKILDALGRISWEGRFPKNDIEVDESDLHFEMVTAFSILQEDVEEIIREYKELNQNLELKVAERIVDYIDKESNLRSILDNSDRVTWLMNTRFELIDFNAAFLKEVKSRYKSNPKINDSILDIIEDERERNIWKERFESTLKGKAGIYLDQETVDGDERVYEIKTFPIKEIGKIKGVSVFVEDITQLKHSQLKLIEKNRDLQKVNSELDSFVYRVSHDLRAPLTSILGLISLMKLESNPDKLAEYIQLQEKSIYKLDLFIKEIINLSRNSRLGVTASKIDFEKLINEIFDEQTYSASFAKVERIVEVENDISFYTDRQRLSIILNNLISNGLKYVSPHEKNPFVKVRVSLADDEKCMIEVSDNGIGISEIHLPKIFEMFFRATQDFTGSGLGLYIVKETVEKLKGKVTVKSTMRQGSIFKVVLPNLKERFEAAPKLDD